MTSHLKRILLFILGGAILGTALLVGCVIRPTVAPPPPAAAP